MDDSSNSGSLVYSRRKLREVPLELFKTAAVKPVRALDLGYNALQAPAVAGQSALMLCRAVLLLITILTRGCHFWRSPWRRGG